MNGNLSIARKKDARDTTSATAPLKFLNANTDEEQSVKLSHRYKHAGPLFS